MKSAYPALGCDAILINGREASAALVSLPVKTFNYSLAQPFPIYIYIQGVTGGMCETSGECSLC